MWMIAPSDRRLFATCLCLALPAQAASSERPLSELSLEELLRVPVTSVSRQDERLQDAPAAVFVISAEDIHRIGAASVPEALRLAPGIEVAQLSGGRWAVSVRGFNNRFANKLLVMIDGRSVYTPVFSGVLWEDFPVTMGDIERIEVVRGAAAALWGANAVNGVINVITRPARDTPGGRAALSADSRDGVRADWRSGIVIDEATQMRISATLSHGATTELRDGSDAQDAPRDARVTLRMDRVLAQGRQLVLSAALSSHRSADGYPLPLIADGPAAHLRLQDQSDQAALNARYQEPLAEGGERRLQLSLAFEHYEFQGIARERRETLEGSWQDSPAALGRHRLVYGADFRYSVDHIDATDPLLTIMPSRNRLRLGSVFLRDQIELVPEQWRLALGAKLENSSYADTELQPDARLLWMLQPATTLWASLATAVRTPSRGERDARLALGTLPPGSLLNPSPLPAEIVAPGNPNLGVERVRSAELGLRHLFGTAVSLDTSLFRQRYSDLFTVNQGTPQFALVDGIPTLILPFVSANGFGAVVDGLEAALDWQIDPLTRAQFAFSTLHVAGVSAPSALQQSQANYISGNVAARRLSVRLSHDFGAGYQLDAMLRHVSALPGGFTPGDRVAPYTSLDLRAAWVAPMRGLELSLYGRNLLAPRHQEFSTAVLPEQDPFIAREVGVSASLPY